MNDFKKEIVTLWQSVTRPGVGRLIQWLMDSDFFAAPCSTEFHLCRPGGLAEHSVNVYLLLKEKVERYHIDATHDSIIICGLGHDFCKANFYKIDETGPTGPQDYRLKKDLGSIVYGRLSAQGLTKKWASDIIDWIEKGRKGEMPKKPASNIIEKED